MEWITHEEEFEEMKNIVTAHLTLAFHSPETPYYHFMRYDGLPLHGLCFGVFSIHWGQTHVWVDIVVEIEAANRLEF